MNSLSLPRNPATLLTSGFFALDVIVRNDHLTQKAGGTAGNVAANLAFLGWNVTSAALLGTDPAGAHLIGDLVNAGVSRDGFRLRDDVITPVVIHEIFESGHRFRFGCPSCGRRFPRLRPFPFEAVDEVLETRPTVFFFDRVSRSTLLMANEVRSQGGLIFFEPQSVPAGEAFRQAVQSAHIVKFNSHRRQQMKAFTEDDSKKLWLVTQGDGGTSWKLGSKWEHIPTYNVKVTDAGGAGDWMTSSLIAMLGSTTPQDSSSRALHEAVQVSQALAALSCEFPGARGMSSCLSIKQIRSRLEALVMGAPHPALRVRTKFQRSRRKAACSSCLAS